MSSAILTLSDEDVRRILTPAAALQVVRSSFVAASRESGRNFPVVRERLEHAVFGVKSGIESQSRVLGLKAGGAFPKNLALGNQAHQSSVLLFDYDTGKPTALVAGNAITALRTAAAAALSIDAMSQREARTLLIVGAGGQAEIHLRLALTMRDFNKVYVWSRSQERAKALIARVANVVDAEPLTDLPAIVPSCDVIITLTPAVEPIIKSADVSPGTHLACMGADTVGKQEVETLLVARSRVISDDIEQSLSIGECQASFRSGLIKREHVLGTLGDVLLGRIKARVRQDDITLFDGTGVALQDICAAAHVIGASKEG